MTVSSGGLGVVPGSHVLGAAGGPVPQPLPFPHPAMIWVSGGILLFEGVYWLVTGEWPGLPFRPNPFLFLKSPEELGKFLLEVEVSTPWGVVWAIPLVDP